MARYMRSPCTTKTRSRMASLHSSEVPGDKELRFIAELVHQNSGIVFQPRNYTALVRAVCNRMVKLGISTTDDYLNQLHRPGNRNELIELTSLLTVQKTSFFRDRSQFELLEEQALPDILSRKPTALPNLQIWSAGCSTGEEPYSIAISLLRSWPYKNAAHILATDISVHALGKALLGSYRKVDLAPLSELENFFIHQKGDQWHISENVRSMVDCKFHNLVSVPFPVPSRGLWDIIFCRNVLIYFNRETVREIIKRFHEVLSPKGYLFLGPSESLYRLVEGFDLVSTDKAFVYQKSDLRSTDTMGAVPTRIPSEQNQTPTRLRSDLHAAYQPAKQPSGPPVELEEALRIAKRLLEKGDSQSAFNRFLQISKQHPDALLPYVMLGKIAADQGSLEEALSWFQLATKIDPLGIEPRFLLAVVQHRIGRDQEAAEELRKVLFLDGQFILGHYYLGVVANHMGDDETARRSFRNVLRSTDFGVDQTACDIMNTLQLTLDMLVSASRAHLDQLEKKSLRKRSNKR